MPSPRGVNPTTQTASPARSPMTVRDYHCGTCGRELRTRSWDRVSEGAQIAEHAWTIWGDCHGAVHALCPGCSRSEVASLAAVAEGKL